MLYNDVYSQRLHQRNLEKLQTLQAREHIPKELQELLDSNPWESYDFWREMCSSYPSYQFSLKPYLPSTYRHAIQPYVPQEQLASYQVRALRRYGNTIVHKQAHLDKLFAHCRALGFEVDIKPMSRFVKEEDTHLVLYVKEKKK